MLALGKLVLWLTGLFIALMTANLSFYLIATAFFLIGGVIARVRRLRDRAVRALVEGGEPGQDAEESSHRGP